MMPPWLRADYARLLAALDAGRLGHALLIHGPRGWGQRELAAALALAIIDRRPDGDVWPDAATLAHPDLRWVAPETPAGQIRIDEVRKLAQLIQQTPRVAERKVAVIDPADAINAQAANALLKTLEEPPLGSHLLLVTSSLAEMLPTIRSRCQLVSVRPVAAADAVAWATRDLSAPRGAQLESLAFELGYAPMRLRQVIDSDDAPLAPVLEQAIVGRTSIGSIVDRWLKQDADLLLERWMRYVADGMKARTEGRQSRLVAIGAVADDALHGFWRELQRARMLVRSTSNPNLRMLLEVLLMAWRDLNHASAARRGSL